ncbi:MAG: hypothetical protein HY898_20075 [Deltaproteobacteria bacterium]|nr:hypothetical protein [Deltaproteobacteria bacterium]
MRSLLTWGAWLVAAAAAIGCAGNAPAANATARKGHSAPKVGAIEQLEQFAQAPSSVNPSTAPVMAPAYVQGEDGDWRVCGAQAYRYEPAAGGPVAVTVRDPSEVTQVIAPSDLQGVKARPERVRVHYVISGRMVLDAEPSRAAAPEGCGAWRNHVRAVVVGAYTIEVEQGADLNEPRASAQPMERAARVIVAGQPRKCLETKSPQPTEGCRVPLVLALGHPDGGSRKVLANIVAFDARAGRGWGQELGAGVDGCDRSFVATGALEQDLERLVSMCKQGAGMVAVTRVLRGEQGEEEQADHHRVRLNAGECYRAFGVGGAGVVELQMGWVAPGGRLIARDLLPRRWSVLPSTGPVCPDADGDWELVIAVERGQGPYAAQIWRLGQAGQRS